MFYTIHIKLKDEPELLECVVSNKESVLAMAWMLEDHNRVGRYRVHCADVGQVHPWHLDHGGSGF